MSKIRATRSTRDWRDFLTSAERKRLTTLDRQIAELGVKVSALRKERNQIQNRATVRAGK